ncbi:MAG: hypothetical protein AAF297_00255 [Planctomycetota bacterium]
MAEMRRSFQNVKSLLGKLDRSIDEARSRRLGDPSPSDDSLESVENDGLETVIGRSEVGGGTQSGPGEGARGSDAARTPGAGATPATARPASPRRSVYGRAKPLNRADDGSPTSKWSG